MGNLISKQFNENKRSVLAVDDVSLILLRLKELLSKKWNVFVAKTSGEAMGILGRNKIDLFILDINLPDTSGLELLGSIRKIDDYKDTPVIMVTATTERDTVREALSLGISAYIAKPYGDHEMAEAVDLIFHED